MNRGILHLAILSIILFFTIIQKSHAFGSSESANGNSNQGTSDMSVLEDQGILFKTQVGTRVSKWINVKNDIPHPLMVWLILNSGAVINECKGSNDLSLPPSDKLVVDEGTTPKKYGFSIPENALTLAHVPAHDHVLLGPINFYPSDRCRWSASAFVGNNLSGVEWIPLRGYGGLFSLVLFDRSEHVQGVDFDVEMMKPLSFSLEYSLMRMKRLNSHDCSLPLVKQLSAKNTGDLPLTVTSIRVCGKQCGQGGFRIQYCKGFTLEPGESIKLLISYQIDFSAAVVHRDVEFVMANDGIFVIPVKASFPNKMLSNCKKEMVWMRVVNSLLGFFITVGLSGVIIRFRSPALAFLKSLRVKHSCAQEQKDMDAPGNSTPSFPPHSTSTTVPSSDMDAPGNSTPSFPPHSASTTPSFPPHSTSTTVPSSDMDAPGNSTPPFPPHSAPHSASTTVPSSDMDAPGNSTPSFPPHSASTSVPSSSFDRAPGAQKTTQKTEQKTAREVDTYNIWGDPFRDVGKDFKSYFESGPWKG